MKRRKARVAVRIPVLVCTDPAGATVKGDAVIEDLSTAGVKLQTRAELRTGDLLFLKFALPVSVACQVRYVKGNGSQYQCGAQIERIGFLDRMKLRDFVKKESKKSA